MLMGTQVDFLSLLPNRSVYITFSDFESVQGLPALRYKVPAEILANTSDNAGFCIPKGNCLGSGVLNVSVCKNGAPIIISFPHFYEADEKFVSAIEGMHPNKEYHETFVDINPLTGVILRAAKRFQINVYVRKLDDFIETGNIQTLVFLVMYINESVLIDKETASRLKSVINTTLIVTNIPYIIMALGVFLGLIFTWLACRGQGSTDEGTADERAPPYEPNQTRSRAWGRKHAHCCDLGRDDMGQPPVSSWACHLVRQEEDTLITVLRRVMSTFQQRFKNRLTWLAVRIL